MGFASGFHPEEQRSPSCAKVASVLVQGDAKENEPGQDPGLQRSPIRGPVSFFYQWNDPQACLYSFTVLRDGSCNRLRCQRRTVNDECRRTSWKSGERSRTSCQEQVFQWNEHSAKSRFSGIWVTGRGSMGKGTENGAGTNSKRLKILRPRSKATSHDGSSDLTAQLFIR
jgi:hypothetical protein